MKANLRQTVWRLGVFVIVTMLGMFALLTVFGQFRFDSARNYLAEFVDVTGLANGNFVRIAGVEVGKVKHLALKENGNVEVSFTADDSVVLTESSRVVIRWGDVIGGRYLSIEEGAGGTPKLAPGETIPVDRTEPALDLDVLIGGFRPLFRALDPDQVNALAGQLIAAFQGQGVTIGSFLSQTAALTNTLADRDLLIGQVVSNLSTVLGSLGDRSDRFATAVESLSGLMKGLADRKHDISNGVAHVNAATATIAELLQQARPPLVKAVQETDRTASVVLADQEYVDHVLENLPAALRILNRQALYGDYFTFYFCEVTLKLNGKGGQPMYVKVAEQTSGRCTPK